MRSMIIEPRVILLSLLLAVCADVAGPERAGDRRTTAPAFVRHRRQVPIEAPDSVSIPPLIPPIVEEMPLQPGMVQ